MQDGSRKVHRESQPTRSHVAQQGTWHWRGVGSHIYTGTWIVGFHAKVAPLDVSGVFETSHVSQRLAYLNGYLIRGRAER